MPSGASRDSNFVEMKRWSFAALFGRSKRKKKVQDAGKNYPPSPKQYLITGEIGVGATATVYAARCLASHETVAIKCIDLDNPHIDLNNVKQEAQTLMVLSHPNVLSAHCAFVVDTQLWEVMPYMAGGSVQTILKTSFPNGLKETTIATVLKEVLKGLAYLHTEGHVHRDVKAANILVHADGSVKLADFGACASVFEGVGGKETRLHSLAGSILWMAPEVMFAEDHDSQGYDSKADIWSLGITAMEMAEGCAPFSGKKPQQIVSELERGHLPRLSGAHFSRSFKKMVGACLQRNPQKRPSAEELMEHSFFRRYGRTPKYVVKNLVDGLPPLEQRASLVKEERIRRIIEARASSS